MKRKLLFNIIVLFPFVVIGQTTTFKVFPFMNGITSIKDGQIEAGPEFNWKNDNNGRTFLIRPFARVPITSKTDNVLQIDRFSTTFKGIILAEFTFDCTSESGKIRRHSFNAQFEVGQTEFKYCPTGTKNEPQKTTGLSYGFEAQYIGYYSKGIDRAWQFSPQLRIRYSYDWKASKEVGVVNAPNNSGVTTTSNMIISGPSDQATFSPAVSLQIYPGRGSFSYSPSVYYDFTGKAASDLPFGNLARLRLESWIFFYPVQKDNPNIKIGLTPFLSIRTSGTDDFNPVEYGGMITVKFGTTFLQFF